MQDVSGLWQRGRLRVDYLLLKERARVAQQKQLECRIVITYLRDGRIKLGMYDPKSTRYEPLGTHGPAAKEVDKAVRGLKESIERAGHRLSFCERSE